jgi:hypothetical protein
LFSPIQHSHSGSQNLRETSLEIYSMFISSQYATG